MNAPDSQIPKDPPRNNTPNPPPPTSTKETELHEVISNLIDDCSTPYVLKFENDFSKIVLSVDALLKIQDMNAELQKQTNEKLDIFVEVPRILLEDYFKELKKYTKFYRKCVNAYHNPRITLKDSFLDLANENAKQTNLIASFVRILNFLCGNVKCLGCYAHGVQSFKEDNMLTRLKEVANAVKQIAKEYPQVHINPEIRQMDHTINENEPRFREIRDSKSQPSATHRASPVNPNTATSTSNTQDSQFYNNSNRPNANSGSKSSDRRVFVSVVDSNENTNFEHHQGAENRSTADRNVNESDNRSSQVGNASNPPQPGSKDPPQATNTSENTTFMTQQQNANSSNKHSTHQRTHPMPQSARTTPPPAQATRPERPTAHPVNPPSTAETLSDFTANSSTPPSTKKRKCPSCRSSAYTDLFIDPADLSTEFLKSSLSPSNEKFINVEPPKFVFTSKNFFTFENSPVEPADLESYVKNSSLTRTYLMRAIVEYFGEQDLPLDFLNSFFYCVEWLICNEYCSSLRLYQYFQEAYERERMKNSKLDQQNADLVSEIDKLNVEEPEPEPEPEPTMPLHGPCTLNTDLEKLMKEYLSAFNMFDYNNSLDKTEPDSPLLIRFSKLIHDGGKRQQAVKRKLKDSEQSVDKEKREHVNTKTNSQAKDREIESLKSEIGRLNGKLDTTETERKRLEHENKDIQLQYTTFINEKSGLYANLNNLSSESSVLKERNQQMATELEVLRNKRATMKSDFVRMETESKSRNSEIERLKESLNKLETEKSKFEQDLMKLDSELKVTKLENQRLATELQNSSSKSSTNSSEFQILVSDNQSLRVENDALKRNLAITEAKAQLQQPQPQTHQSDQTNSSAAYDRLANKLTELMNQTQPQQAPPQAAYSRDFERDLTEKLRQESMKTAEALQSFSNLQTAFNTQQNFWNQAENAYRNEIFTLNEQIRQLHDREIETVRSVVNELYQNSQFPAQQQPQQPSVQPQPQPQPQPTQADIDARIQAAIAKLPHPENSPTTIYEPVIENLKSLNIKIPEIDTKIDGLGTQMPQLQSTFHEFKDIASSLKTLIESLKTTPEIPKLDEQLLNGSSGPTNLELQQNIDELRSLILDKSSEDKTAIAQLLDELQLKTSPGFESVKRDLSSDSEYLDFQAPPTEQADPGAAEPLNHQESEAEPDLIKSWDAVIMVIDALIEINSTMLFNKDVITQITRVVNDLESKCNDLND